MLFLLARVRCFAALPGKQVESACLYGAIMANSPSLGFMPIEKREGHHRARGFKTAQEDRRA